MSRFLLLILIMGTLVACSNHHKSDTRYREFISSLKIGMDIKGAEAKAKDILGYGLEDGVLTREALTQYCRENWRCVPDDLPQRLTYKEEANLSYVRETVRRAWEERLFSIPYWVTIVYSEDGNIIGWVNEGKRLHNTHPPQ